MAESYFSAVFLDFALGPKSGSLPGRQGYKGREKLTESQQRGQIQGFQVLSGNHQGVFRQRVFPYPLCRESRSERSTMAKREIPGGKDLPCRCTSERPNDQNSADCKRGRRKGATSKNVKNRQKVSKSFSTLFDNFRAGQKTSKIVKKCQKYFRHFSTIFARHQFSGPFWVALIGLRDSQEFAEGALGHLPTKLLRSKLLIMLPGSQVAN